MSASKLIAKVTGVEFEVADKMVIADPCYLDLPELGDPPGALVIEAAGVWIGEIDTNSAGRVTTLRIRRKNAVREPLTMVHTELMHVDSGQMYAGDVADLPLDYSKLLESYRSGPGGEWESHDILAAEGGVVSSTGNGDGAYPLHIWHDDVGVVEKIEVRFIEEES